jgi:transcriptional regulator with XRE-family HTH domain
MSTHHRLKSWLNAAGLTQAEFARKIEYDKGNLHRLLNGGLRPSLDLAFKIERVTDGVIPAAAWAEAA